jgi:hypothetical protein
MPAAYELIISGHQQRWPRPLPGAILRPSALLVVADFNASGNTSVQSSEGLILPVLNPEHRTLKTLIDCKTPSKLFDAFSQTIGK